MTQYSRFINRLDKSRPAVFRVAEYLHKSGFTVTIPAIHFTPSAERHAEFLDDGDIFAEKNNEKHRIEVKHIDTDFHDLESWPYKITLVSNVKTVERANNSVTAYIIVNKPMTHIGIIWKKTKEKWTTIELLAKNTGNTEKFYCCDPKLLDFRKL